MGDNIIRGCFSKVLAEPHMLPGWLRGHHDAGLCHKMSPKTFLPEELQNAASDKPWQVRGVFDTLEG